MNQNLERKLTGHSGVSRNLAMLGSIATTPISEPVASIPVPEYTYHDVKQYTALHSGQWCDVNKIDRTYVVPEYARFRLQLSRTYNPHAIYKTEYNPKGYSKFPSIDWNNKVRQYSERAGLNGLHHFVTKILRPDEYNQATIWVNLTKDLTTTGRNYNYQIAHYVNGQFTWKAPTFFVLCTNTKTGKQKILLNIDKVYPFIKHTYQDPNKTKANFTKNKTT